MATRSDWHPDQSGSHTMDYLRLGGARNVRNAGVFALLNNGE